MKGKANQTMAAQIYNLLRGLHARNHIVVRCLLKAGAKLVANREGQTQPTLFKTKKTEKKQKNRKVKKRSITSAKSQQCSHAATKAVPDTLEHTYLLCLLFSISLLLLPL